MPDLEKFYWKDLVYLTKKLWNKYGVPKNTISVWTKSRTSYSVHQIQYCFHPIFKHMKKQDFGFFLLYLELYLDISSVPWWYALFITDGFFDLKFKLNLPATVLRKQIYFQIDSRCFLFPLKIYFNIWLKKYSLLDFIIFSDEDFFYKKKLA